ncbi:MAG: SDR family oxidoreductase [Aeromicrobium sp.]|uniref:SDR family oxidoreductase n=1 Tax=Aeromicrobium sp. TaxID=1871063 RepID=UPI0039E711A3
MSAGTLRHEGRAAIVTGASRGIGYAIAERIVAEGGKVVVTARKAEALAAAAGQLGTPEQVRWVAGNASDPAHQDEVVATALEAFGSLDYMVNNTGINPAYGRMVDIDLEAASKIFDTNVVAAIGWAQKAYRASFEANGGAIVNIASVAGLLPAPNIGTYGASKAALIHVTKELAVELGPTIRVNAVAPAVVKTRFAGALYEGREEEVARPYPLKRLGEPEDIGSVVSFLLSSDASWVTGQTITVDGGLLLTGGV